MLGTVGQRIALPRCFVNVANSTLFDSLNLQACPHVQGIDELPSNGGKNLKAPIPAPDLMVDAGKGFALSSFLLNSSANI